MAIITLTTDYGTKDYHAASVKGSILRELPDAHIVDVTHEIRPFNLSEAAYVLRNAYKDFPKGSIHIIGIDSELTESKPHLAVEVDGHFFIGADTGIFALLFPDLRPSAIIELNIAQDTDSYSFPARDVFVTAACHLARGGKISLLGSARRAFVERKGIQPSVTSDGKEITAAVVYIDHFGNVVTNVTRQIFKDIGKGRDFEIHLPRMRHSKESIRTLRRRYSEMGEGQALALFNSAGHLEIAIAKSDLQTVGGASSLLGISYGETIKITFA
ncbi:SAM-dependent chlorinase/fluorinase [Cryomorphaceae bacterium]|nr:SAM-dependent chlorinase/fluorinase [Cryomorphaceae bacterium]